MEKFIRDKYQYKKFMIPIKSSPPASPPPAPTPKDPVPRRTGGVSLGSHSDLEDVSYVFRAPSRAKSTPIVSSNSLSGRGTNVLSPPSPALPTASSGNRRERVFGNGGLPFRPATASALEPRIPNSRHILPSPQPTPSPQPPTPDNQPPLQYLPPSASSVPTSTLPSSNSLWRDMMSLSLQETMSPSTGATQSPFATSTSASTLGLGGIASPFSGLSTSSSTSLSAFHSSGDTLGIGGTPRSFSMPSTLSPSAAGISAFGGGLGATTGGNGLNPFSPVSAHSSGSSFGGGSHLQSHHTSMPLGNNFTASSLGSTAFVGAHASGLGASAWGSNSGPSASPFNQNGLGGMTMSSSVMSPSALGQSSFGMGANNAFGTIGRTSTNPPFQQPFQSNSMGSPFSSNLPSTPSFQGGFGSTMLSSPSSPFGGVDSQTSFAQSMLPAHMKGHSPATSRNNTGTNPFGHGQGRVGNNQSPFGAFGNGF